MSNFVNCAGLSGKLVEILSETNQEVPAWLQNMAQVRFCAGQQCATAGWRAAGQQGLVVGWLHSRASCI